MNIDRLRWPRWKWELLQVTFEDCLSLYVTRGQRTSIRVAVCEWNGEPIYGRLQRLDHWTRGYKNQFNWPRTTDYSGHHDSSPTEVEAESNIRLPIHPPFRFTEICHRPWYCCIGQIDWSIYNTKARNVSTKRHTIAREQRPWSSGILTQVGNWFGIWPSSPVIEQRTRCPSSGQSHWNRKQNSDG